MNDEKKYFSPENEEAIKACYSNKLCNDICVGDIVLSANCVVRRNIAGEKFVTEEGSEQQDVLINKLERAVRKACSSVYRSNPFDTNEFNSTSIMLTAKSPYIASLLEEPVNKNYKVFLSNKYSKSFYNLKDIYSKNTYRYTLLGYDNHITHITTGSDAVQAFSVALNDLDKIKELAEIEYAAHEKFGYLTTKLENTGSGITLATLIALPALAIRGGLEAVLNAVQRLEYDVAPAVDALCKLDAELAEKQRSRLFGNAAPGAIYYISTAVPMENYEEYIKRYAETISMVAAAEAEERLKLSKANKYLIELEVNVASMTDIYADGAANILGINLNPFLTAGENQLVISHKYFFDLLSTICLDLAYFFDHGPVKKGMKHISPFAHYQCHSFSSFWFLDEFEVDLIARHNFYVKLIEQIGHCTTHKEMDVDLSSAGEMVSFEVATEMLNESTSSKKKSNLKTKSKGKK
jgi:protein-arginine kinase